MCSIAGRRVKLVFNLKASAAQIRVIARAQLNETPPTRVPHSWRTRDETCASAAGRRSPAAGSEDNPLPPHRSSPAIWARARRCLHRSMDGGGRSAGDMGIVDGETILVIHDDADAGTVTKEAVSAIREVARHIGKVDRRYDEGQLAEIEKAFRWLQAALTSKKFTNAHRTKRREAPRRRERPCRHDRAHRNWRG